MELLLSNTLFGVYLRTLDLNDHRKVELRDNFDNFLNIPLELWMFVPCKLVDCVWVVLEEPKRWKDYLEFPESFDGNKEWYDFYEYQEAKGRVLFKDFTYHKFEKEGDFPEYELVRNSFCKISLFEFKACTIESLITLHRANATLTDTARKMIGFE